MYASSCSSMFRRVAIAGSVAPKSSDMRFASTSPFLREGPTTCHLLGRRHEVVARDELRPRVFTSSSRIIADALTRKVGAHERRTSHRRAPSDGSRTSLSASPTQDVARSKHCSFSSPESARGSFFLDMLRARVEHLLHQRVLALHVHDE